MVEVRSVSTDGKAQTLDTYMGEVSGEPQMKRVMMKSERQASTKSDRAESDQCRFSRY
jgi:hypothetical protein